MRQQYLLFCNYEYLLKHSLPVPPTEHIPFLFFLTNPAKEQQSSWKGASLDISNQSQPPMRQKKEIINLL